MPDTKITALTAIGANPIIPATFPIPMVDLTDTTMAASGTTKKVTVNQILGAGGTATLASATITGDLTVDTNVLKVDSANNRVGIRTASPAEPLTVDNSSGVTTGAIRIYAIDQSHSRLAIQNGNGQAYHLVAGNPGASNAGFALYDNTAAATRLYVDNTGVHTWQNVGGVAGTAMTLNSTGLGVGVASPAAKLDVAGNAALTGTSGFKYLYFNLATDTNSVRGAKIGKNYDSTYDLNIHATTAASGGGNEAAIKFFRNNTDVSMTLDASGNLLVGKTANYGTGETQTLQLKSSVVFASDNTGSASNRNWSIGTNASAAGNMEWTISSTNTGWPNFAYRLQLTSAGDVNNTTGTYGTISDLRLKENISDARNYLADLLKLRVVKYSLKEEASAVATKLGFIAQEVEQVFPNLVDQSDKEYEGAEGIRSVKTSILIPMLLKAIQELTARVQTLETR